jgi:hypothetical protein
MPVFAQCADLVSHGSAHHFGKSDPDPHQRGKKDPHPDPSEVKASGAVEAQNNAIEGRFPASKSRDTRTYRTCKPGSESFKRFDAFLVKKNSPQQEVGRKSDARVGSRLFTLSYRSISLPLVLNEECYC